MRKEDRQAYVQNWSCTPAFSRSSRDICYDALRSACASLRTRLSLVIFSAFLPAYVVHSESGKNSNGYATVEIMNKMLSTTPSALRLF